MSSIGKYTSFFHDGSIIAINHVDSEMIVFMESAEVDKEDLDDSITLSKDDRIRGKLHIEGILKIEINNKLFSGVFKKNTMKGGVLILNSKITLLNCQ